MRTVLSSVMTFSLALGGPLVSQEAEGKPVAQPESRPALPPYVAMVQKGLAAAVVECTVSSNGATSVVLTADQMLHFTALADHFGGGAEAGSNDKAFKYPMHSVMLNPSGERLVGQVNRSAFAVLTKRPRVLHQLRGVPGTVAVAYHPDGSAIVVGSHNGRIRLFDGKSGKPVRYLPMQDKDLTFVGFANGGTTLVTATSDKKLRTFSYPACFTQPPIDLPNLLTQGSFSADGGLLVSPAGEQVQVIDMKKAKTLKPALSKPIEVGAEVLRAAISGDGKLVAVACSDGSEILFDRETGKRRFSWPAHPGKRVVTLRFAKVAGRHLLVSAAKKGAVLYFDVDKLHAPKPAATKKGGKGKKRGKTKRRGKKR